MESLGCDRLQILGGFAGGWCREDRDEMPPRGSPSDGHGGGRIRDEEKTCQAKNPSDETENHRSQGSEARRAERVFDKRARP
jgi:hypothetical protein